jgi:hypothetical protein
MTFGTIAIKHNYIIHGNHIPSKQAGKQLLIIKMSHNFALTNPPTLSVKLLGL